MSINEIIDKRLKASISKYSEELEGLNHRTKESAGFMLYGLECIFKNLTSENIEAGVVDSAYRKEEHDYGIDAVYVTGNNKLIEEVDQLEDYDYNSKFIFHILQFKDTTRMNQGDLLKLKQGIKVAFIENKCEREMNQYMYNKMRIINEIKLELFDKFPTERIAVNVYIIFKGSKDNILNNDLLRTQISEIQEILQSNCYSNNEILIIDSQEILRLEKEVEKIKGTLQYQKNMKYIIQIDEDNELTGYIAVIKGSEIGELLSEWGDVLFEANIRDYYKKSSINEKIFDTCIDEKESNYFWSFNNGLTVVGNKVDELPEDRIRIYGIQIVNGCQTANTIYKAYYNKLRKDILIEKKESSDLSKDEDKELKNIENKVLNDNTSVLVKIIETKDPNLIYRITETTNSQTSIQIFSLKAQDDIQKNIEEYLLLKGIFYERRVNYYKNKGKKNIISIKKLFQLYVSYLLFKPSQARTSPKTLFEGLYDKVFPEPSIEDRNYLLYLIPILIDLKIIKQVRRIQRGRLESDEYKLELLSYGKLHLGLFILNSIIGKYNKKLLIENSDNVQNALDDDKEFDKHFSKALENLEKIVKRVAGQRKESVSAALKSKELDNRIVRFIASSGE